MIYASSTNSNENLTHLIGHNVENVRICFNELSQSIAFEEPTTSFKNIIIDLSDTFRFKLKEKKNQIIFSRLASSIGDAVTATKKTFPNSKISVLLPLMNITKGGEFAASDFSQFFAIPLNEKQGVSFLFKNLTMIEMLKGFNFSANYNYNLYDYFKTLKIIKDTMPKASFCWDIPNYLRDAQIFERLGFKWASISEYYSMFSPFMSTILISDIERMGNNPDTQHKARIPLQFNKLLQGKPDFLNNYNLILDVFDIADYENLLAVFTGDSPAPPKQEETITSFFGGV